MKKFISYTAVAYEAGDIFGHALAWCSLLPIFLIVVQFSTLLLAESKKRRLQSGSMLGGQLINEAINYTIKQIVKQPRPPASGRSDYGMPSSHSQFAAFALVAFLTLLSTTNTTPRLIGKKSVSLPSATLFQHSTGKRRYYIWMIKLVAYTTAILVPFSRVYLDYHDTMQVLVGSVLGLVIGCVWDSFYRAWIMPMIPVDTKYGKD